MPFRYASVPVLLVVLLLLWPGAVSPVPADLSCTSGIVAETAASPVSAGGAEHCAVGQTAPAVVVAADARALGPTAPPPSIRHEPFSRDARAPPTR